MDRMPGRCGRNFEPAAPPSRPVTRRAGRWILGAWRASARGRLKPARLLALACTLCSVGTAAEPTPQTAAPSTERREPWNPKVLGGSEFTVVKPGSVVPPRVLPPCPPGRCPFAGQTVTVLVSRSLIAGIFPELKDEFEAATGARLEVVEAPYNEHFENFLSAAINHRSTYDASIVAAWWVGELVAGGYLLAYDKYYRDPRFPKWNIDDVLPAPRSLLEYSGKKYMVANDHDAQVMYYRRDLFADAQHQAAFRRKYGYPLAVPDTWAKFRDVAEYFNGRDLNGDNLPDHGVTLALKAGKQAMFHFMSLSAPFVIGPDNPKLYWFDPQSMKPLIDSPGHVRALQLLVELVRFGPKEMLGWEVGQSWDHFLAGRAALAFTWGDLGALAQQEGSKVRGKTGAAPIPGAAEYYSVQQHKLIAGAQPNRVGNTTGGNWAGVISKYSKAPEASYYLLALMATREKSEVYAARGWDAIDPGRRYHFLPPDGSATLETYLKAGWDEADVRDYSRAYFANFSNPLQLPYLRIPGTFAYLQALDLHLLEAASGHSSPEAALKATAIDFEEITIRLGRERQRRAYKASLGL